VVGIRRSASLACGLRVLCGGSVHAADGAGRGVTGDRVNVRARPPSGAPVLLQVDRTDPALEVARQGDWVQVRLPEHDAEGWIHGSLLAAAGGGQAQAAATATATPPPVSEPAGKAPVSEPQPPASEPPPPADSVADAGGAATQSADPRLAAVGSPTDQALERFRATIGNLNTRALAVAGVELFSDVRMAGDGVTQVVATAAWRMVPEAGRQSYMNTMLERWRTTVGSPLARLQVVDESGQVMSERAGP
jgi:hypothetical protein